MDNYIKWSQDLDEESNLRCGVLNRRKNGEGLEKDINPGYNVFIPYSVSPETINDNNTAYLFPNLLKFSPDVSKLLRFLSYKRMENALQYQHKFWTMIYETNSWYSFKHEIKSQGGGQLATVGENIQDMPRYQIEIAFAIYEVTIKLCYRNKFSEINIVKDIIQEDLIPFLEQIKHLI
jgi:hypothetical protein